MSKSSTYSFRMDDDLKKEGDAILSALGVKPSHAFTLFYKQLTFQKGIPFDLKLPEGNTPNASLIQSFEEAKKEGNLKSYSDAQSAINDMWNND